MHCTTLKQEFLLCRNINPSAKSSIVFRYCSPNLSFKKSGYQQVQRTVPSYCQLLVSNASRNFNFPDHNVDRDLWEVLEICDLDELELVYRILFTRNPFSPVVKNMVTEADSVDTRFYERNSIMQKIQSQFQFLAASSIQTLRGIRPTYRETLLHIRKK